MIDAILYVDVGGFPASLDERPARYVVASDAPPIAPWRRMTEAELRARIASTDAAWNAYQAARPVEIAPLPPLLVRSPDGRVWKIAVLNDGRLSAQPV